MNRKHGMLVMLIGLMLLAFVPTVNADNGGFDSTKYGDCILGYQPNSFVNACFLTGQGPLAGNRNPSPIVGTGQNTPFTWANNQTACAPGNPPTCQEIPDSWYLCPIGNICVPVPFLVTPGPLRGFAVDVLCNQPDMTCGCVEDGGPLVVCTPFTRPF